MSIHFRLSLRKKSLKGGSLFKKLIAPFFIIIFLPVYSKAAIKENTKINYKFASAQSDKKCNVEGVFYSQDKAVVMIGGNLYSPGDSLSAGTIIKVSPDRVTIKFQNSEREYRVGDSVCQKIENGPPDEELQQVTDEFDKITPIIKDFLAKHNENKALFNLASKKTLFGTRRNIKEIVALSSKMIALIKNYRQQLTTLTLPTGSDRCRLLTIKMLDIAEDAWRVLMEGDERQAEILLNRMLRISQELGIESARLSALLSSL
jgi:hypothetical protein